MTILFSSDFHFGHAKILEYSKRPFKDKFEMDKTIILNWNAKVTESDKVYVLGDFSFYPKEESKRILNALNGTKVLVRGNHDRSVTASLDMGFKEVYNSLELELDGYKLFLRHIPPQDMDDSSRKYKPEFLAKEPKYYDFFLAGHVHNSWKRKDKVINVGVDQWNFTPQTLAELIAL